MDTGAKRCLPPARFVPEGGRVPDQPDFPFRSYPGRSMPFAKRTRFFAIRSIVEPNGWSLTR